MQGMDGTGLLAASGAHWMVLGRSQTWYPSLGTSSGGRLGGAKTTSKIKTEETLLCHTCFRVSKVVVAGRMATEI